MKERVRLVVQAYADAKLVIPKVLAQNAGFDPQDSIVKMQQEGRDHARRRCRMHYDRKAHSGSVG